MPIMDCLKKMGFSRDEAQAIIDDVGDGRASDVVREHIKMLEKERDDIVKQASKSGDAAAVGADNEIRSVIAEHGGMEVPTDDGGIVSAHDAITLADAEIASAKQDEPGFEAAVSCALRG